LQPDHGGISLRPYDVFIDFNWVCGILHWLRLSFHYAFNGLIGFAILFALKLVTPGDAFLTIVHRWRPSGLSIVMNHDLSDGLRTLTQDYSRLLVKLGCLFSAEKEFRPRILLRELKVFEGWAVLILMLS
jgi:hypothetical protein